MNRRRWFTFVNLALAFVLCLWGIEGDVRAQTTKNAGSTSGVNQRRGTTQAQRVAARASQGAQKTGVSKTFAGINPQTATLSPLAPATQTALQAAMNPGGVPDYFGVANYANSPLPTIDPRYRCTHGRDEEIRRLVAGLMRRFTVGHGRIERPRSVYSHCDRGHDDLSGKRLLPDRRDRIHEEDAHLPARHQTSRLCAGECPRALRRRPSNIWGP